MPLRLGRDDRHRVVASCRPINRQAAPRSGRDTPTSRRGPFAASTTSGQVSIEVVR
jgi:hypothetical protein